MVGASFASSSASAFAGALASIGSEQITFSYVAGQWYYQPSDLSVYAHHNTAQATAALRAQGECD